MYHCQREQCEIWASNKGCCTVSLKKNVLNSLLNLIPSNKFLVRPNKKTLDLNYFQNTRRGEERVLSVYDGRENGEGVSTRGAASPNLPACSRHGNFSLPHAHALELAWLGVTERENFSHRESQAWRRLLHGCKPGRNPCPPNQSSGPCISWT